MNLIIWILNRHNDTTPIQHWYYTEIREIGELEKTSWKVLDCPSRNWKEWSWKVRAEVGNFQFWSKLSSCSETFQLHNQLSNFVWFFPTSLSSFQIKQIISNLRLSNLKLSNFLFFPIALSNYTYPYRSNDISTI